MLLLIQSRLGLTDYYAWMLLILFLVLIGLYVYYGQLIFTIIMINFSLSLCRLPHPSECNLYYVNRDTLFSFHKESELFLQVVL